MPASSAGSPSIDPSQARANAFLSLANSVTAIRMLLITPFAYWMAHAGGRAAQWALVIYIVALATDFADGPLARHRGTVTAIGGTFDHTTDFLFVTTALFAGASRGAFPWILPILIVVAFAQYFIDSYWVHRKGGLRKSKLGRYNGILYFVPLALDIVIRLGLRFFLPVLTMLVWALVASTIVSIGQRLAFSFLAEEAPRSSPQK